MKHTTILITAIFFLVAFSINAQEITSLTDRLSELEKQNKQLQIDIDDLKRSNDTKTIIKNKVAIQKDQWGEGVGFEIFSGMQGIYSRAGLGIISPRMWNFFSITTGAVFSSGMLSQLYNNDNDIIKYSSMMFNGYLTLKFSSPLLFNFIRVYGATEFSPGFKFSTVADLGKNFSIGSCGFGGVEFFTAEWASFFIEAGGGGIFTFSFDNNKYLTDEGWVGSGFGLKVGGRFYIPVKKAK